ncbi:MAG: hypothetical protein WDO19_01560 [Bacteroidota bacterium]
MSINNIKASSASRREFIVKGSMASMALLVAGPASWSKPFFTGDKPDSKFFGVQIGVITYSFRSMPGTVEQLLQYIVNSGISAIELMGDAVEEYAGKPANPVKFPPFVPGQKDRS